MRTLALIVVLVLMLCRQAEASYAVVVHTIAGSANMTSVTTSSQNSTGANFCWVGVARNPGVAAGTLSDSKSNSYTALTQRGGSDSGTFMDTFYVYAPTVGTGHTWTYSGAGSNFPVIGVLCLSGAIVSPFDQESGAQTAAMASTSLQAGVGVTPSVDNEILIIGINIDNADAITSSNINSGFTVSDALPTDGANHYGMAQAYLIQTTAGAVNPTWTWTTATGASTALATFKGSAPSGIAPIDLRRRRATQ